MRNSSSNYILSKSITELRRIKPRNHYLKLDTKNNNNNSQKNQAKVKDYSTINFDPRALKEKDAFLITSISNRIKKGKRKIFKQIYSKETTRNKINMINEIKEKQNKTSLIKQRVNFNDKNIIKDNEYQYNNSNNKNSNYKKIKYSNINRCFTENNYNFSNNKIIIPIYQGIFDYYKLNKVKSNSNTNSSIKNKKRKIADHILNKKVLNKINNQIYKDKKSLSKDKSNKSGKNSRLKIKYINEKSGQKINEKEKISRAINSRLKNNFNNNNSISIYSDKIETKNKTMNKSINISSKNLNILNNIKNSFRYKNNNQGICVSHSSNISFISFGGIDILNKLFKKRRLKTWKILKYKMLKIKYYKIFNMQTISYNDIQIKNNLFKNQILNDLNIKNKNLLITTNHVNHSDKNIFIPQLDEFLDLPKVKKRNQKILKNKKNDNTNFENQTIKLKLKYIYIKYLIEKKKNIIKAKLRKALYKINKNNFIINNKEIRKKYLLKKFIQIKEQNNNFLLRKSFIKFYFICKLSKQQKKSNSFKDLPDDYILLRLLSRIFYQKEKDNFLLLKKYFDKFRLNTKLIENIMKEEEKRNRILKLIITKNINHNNIIIKSILKQWFLRSKIIKFAKLNIFNEIKEEKKIIKKENLIKGIKKLNSIFKTDKEKHITKNNEKNYNNEIINTNDKIIINNNDSKSKISDKKDSLQKIYRDKYCTDCIIEEKEEQNEDTL